MFAMGLGGMGFFKTMGVVINSSDEFERDAYAALLTNPKMCQTILEIGRKSSGLSLSMA